MGFRKGLHLPLALSICSAFKTFMKGFSMNFIRNWCADVRKSFWKPTAKQAEAFGRWMHTLSAASLIGAISMLFSDQMPIKEHWVEVLGLLILSVLLLAEGTRISKGA
jgi:hypothetical protein